MLTYLRGLTLRPGVRSVLVFPVKLCVMPVVRARRRRFSGTTFVGVTGSAGKTTTRKLLEAVLGVAGPVIASRGTSNRAKELVRVLLKVRREHRFCVQELGAFGPGTLEEMLWALEPDVAVVTNVGTDHFSAFRDIEVVAAEKGKLVAAIPSSGLAVLNADDARVRAMAAQTDARVILYGLSEEADVRAEDVRSAWPEQLKLTLVHDGRRYPVETSLHGETWVTAVLAALATGIGIGIGVGDAVAAIASVKPVRHRLSVTTTPKGVTFLQDDWKASVWTVPGALELLGATGAERRVAVIGQLADDPRKPRVLYPAVARQAREHADLVVLVGRWAHHGLRARSGEDDDSIVAFPAAAEASAFLDRILEPGDVVLVKGTHGGEHLERLTLAQTGRVDCWRVNCRKGLWCEDCRLLTRGFGGEPHPASKKSRRRATRVP
jgi:UDP-N-acetylmuramyl pentapeptide synthase